MNCQRKKPSFGSTYPSVVSSNIQEMARQVGGILGGRQEDANAWVMVRSVKYPHLTSSSIVSPWLLYGILDQWIITASVSCWTACPFPISMNTLLLTDQSTVRSTCVQSFTSTPFGRPPRSPDVGIQSKLLLWTLASFTRSSGLPITHASYLQRMFSTALTSSRDFKYVHVLPDATISNNAQVLFVQASYLVHRKLPGEPCLTIIFTSTAQGASFNAEVTLYSYRMVVRYKIRRRVVEMTRIVRCSWIYHYLGFALCHLERYYGTVFTGTYPG
ncbi:hypothetical protein C8Q75DRAFT_474302 [Abortiporus biennis]|nr:hypothetical protein C8Q75DRAFT_474302 [Abortiporus biennis]